MRTSENAQNANFALTEFSEVKQKEGMGTSPYPHRCADLACCLLLTRSPESRTSRFAHDLHALLGSEQPGSIGRSEVPAPSCGQHNSAGSGVVGSLIDGQAIILAEAQVPTDEPTTHALYLFAHGCAPVLRVVGEGCPGLRGVGELRHVDWHWLGPPSSHLLLFTSSGLALSTMCMIALVCSRRYSPECVEEEFSEVRSSKWLLYGSASP